MTDLARLIEKLSAASEGSDALDFAIMQAIGEMPQRANWEDVRGDYDYGICWHDSEEGDYISLRKYTTSLDAALSLVPEGGGWSITDWVSFANAIFKIEPPRVHAGWRATVRTTVDVDPQWNGKAATPALALCIAALKARAALAEEK